MPAREGHSTVSPYVMAKDASRLIDFLDAVFGAEVLLRIDRDDGTIAHASVRIGDTVVMVSDGTDEYPAFPIWLHIYVDDADATFQRALANGGTAVAEPKDNPDGDRRGGVSDPAGNVWWIASATA